MEKILELTPEIAKEVNHFVFETMREIRKQIDFASTKGPLKRNFYDRLNDADLWDCTSIAEEYIKIQNKTSTLPRTLRDAVTWIFEAGLNKYLLKHSKDNEVQ